MRAHTACAIELPLSCAGGSAVLRVVLSEHDGWDVSVRRDGYVIAHQHCGDWHRVERLRTRIEANRTTLEVRELRQPMDSAAV